MWDSRGGIFLARPSIEYAGEVEIVDAAERAEDGTRDGISADEALVVDAAWWEGVWTLVFVI